MGALASTRSIYYYYLKKGHIISELGKKILFGSLYYSNTNYYKAVLSQYVNFNSYINTYNKSLNLGSVHTSVAIQPDILGAEARAVMGMHGKPDFVFTEKALSVYVYKWKLNGLKTRCEVHFYKNRAFLVNYIYNQLEKRQKDYISESLTGKYLSQYTREVDLLGTKISDMNNNVLFMDNYLMGLKVTYISSCECDWYEAMASYVNESKTKKEEQMRIGERRFFNRI